MLLLVAIQFCPDAIPLIEQAMRLAWGAFGEAIAAENAGELEDQYRVMEMFWAYSQYGKTDKFSPANQAIHA